MLANDSHSSTVYENAMSTKPRLSHRPTSATLSPKGLQITNLVSLISLICKILLSNVRNAAETAAHVSPSIYDVLMLVGICVMLAGPWVLFGVIWGLDGIQMNEHVAQVVTEHPHAANFFITSIGHLLSMIVGILFSFAIVRLPRNGSPTTTT